MKRLVIMTVFWASFLATRAFFSPACKKKLKKDEQKAAYFWLVVALGCWLFPHLATCSFRNGWRGAARLGDRGAAASPHYGRARMAGRSTCRRP